LIKIFATTKLWNYYHVANSVTKFFCLHVVDVNWIKHRLHVKDSNHIPLDNASHNYQLPSIDLPSLQPAKSISPLNRGGIRAWAINYNRFWFPIAIFFTMFTSLWQKIHKYFPSRRAMTAHSIGHEKKERRKNIAA
jgi:hypothetical protein